MTHRPGFEQFAGEYPFFHCLEAMSSPVFTRYSGDVTIKHNLRIPGMNQLAGRWSTPECLSSTYSLAVSAGQCRLGPSQMQRSESTSSRLFCCCTYTLAAQCSGRSGGSTNRFSGRIGEKVIEGKCGDVEEFALSFDTNNSAINNLPIFYWFFAERRDFSLRQNHKPGKCIPFNAGKLSCFYHFLEW